MKFFSGMGWAADKLASKKDFLDNGRSLTM